MEKQDLLYGAAALVLVVIIALVIKPAMTGQQPDIGIPGSPSPTPTSSVVTTIARVTDTPEKIPTSPPPPTRIPTTPVIWNNSVQTIAFVDPMNYGYSLNESIPAGTRIENTPVNTTLITFAKISGRYSGTSEIMNIPFPYWELWYTVEPSGDTAGKGQQLSTSTVTGPKQSGIQGGGSSQTVIQGSFSVTTPQFIIQVMDGDDPNRIVRAISPPGGIDKDLWIGKSIEDTYTGKTVAVPDPRPWKEKFFEGERNYYFIIDAKSLDSYSVELKVPARYIS